MKDVLSDEKRTKQPATIIDFEVASHRITSERIASALLRIAGDESVRVLEALASTIVNNLKTESDIDQPFALERVRLLQPTRMIHGADQARTETIKRIARRALRGTLPDHSCGANAFHRIEITPEWTRDILPVAVIGPFLFYRI